MRHLVELIRTARVFESVPVGFRSSSLNLFRLCFKLVGYKSHLLSLSIFLEVCCLIQYFKNLSEKSTSTVMNKYKAPLEAIK